MTAAFSNAQHEILRLFAENLSEPELFDLKNWLIEFRYRRLAGEMNRLWDEAKISPDILREWSEEHLRTPYLSQNEFLKKGTDA